MADLSYQAAQKVLNADPEEQIKILQDYSQNFPSRTRYFKTHTDGQMFWKLKSFMIYLFWMVVWKTFTIQKFLNAYFMFCYAG